MLHRTPGHLAPGSRRSRRRQIEAAQQLQQRGLARARHPDDRDALAAGDLQVHPVQDIESDIALSKLLARPRALSTAVAVRGAGVSFMTQRLGRLRARRTPGG